MIDIALNYLVKHKLVPLPCMGDGDSKGKIPLIKWKEIQELPTSDQVREWFKKYPNANLGFKTGKVSRILVLDNDGVEITEPMPFTPTVTSQPGHFHSYFLAPDFYVPPSASKIGEHLDIRCDQAFIVGPPSKHFNKQTGEINGEYQWIDGMSPDDIPFAPCPSWLITKIKETLNNTHGFDWSGALNVGTGARDDTLKSAAASLIAKGFNQNDALNILRGINATYNPPLEDKLVINKLETAIEFIRSQQPSKKNRTDNVPTLLKDLYTEHEGYEWIWENAIAKGHTTILSALFKSGKSTLLRCLLRAMCNEEEFIGQPTKKTSVLIITEESKNEWIEKREIFELDGDIPIWIWSRPYFTKLKYNEWVDFVTKDILNFCIENKIEMIVCDTVSTFWAVTQENDSMDMEQNLKPFIVLTEKNIAVFLLQQDNKQGGTFGRSVRGSTALPGFADELITFSRPEKDNFKTRHREIDFFGRLYNAETKLVITLKEDNTYDAGIEKWKYSKSERIRIVMEIITKSKQPLTNKEIREGWDESLYGDKPSEDSFFRYTKELTADNILKLVDEVLVGVKTNRKVPRFGLKDKIYHDQIDFSRDTTLGTAVSSVKDELTADRSPGYSSGGKEKMTEWDPRI